MITLNTTPSPGPIARASERGWKIALDVCRGGAKVGRRWGERGANVGRTVGRTRFAPPPGAKLGRIRPSVCGPPAARTAWATPLEGSQNSKMYYASFVGPPHPPTMRETGVLGFSRSAGANWGERPPFYTYSNIYLEQGGRSPQDLGRTTPLFQGPGSPQFAPPTPPPPPDGPS